MPLAAVLWNGGISFGGVAAFIFGDLIIPPILNIYRKHDGGKPTMFLFVSFYLVMVIAALSVEGIFFVLGWLPSEKASSVSAATISFNYTTMLDMAFFILAAILVVTFLRSGGPRMMRMMAGEGGYQPDYTSASGRGRSVRMEVAPELNGAECVDNLRRWSSPCDCSAAPSAFERWRCWRG